MDDKRRVSSHLPSIIIYLSHNLPSHHHICLTIYLLTIKYLSHNLPCHLISSHLPIPWSLHCLSSFQTQYQLIERWENETEWDRMRWERDEMWDGKWNDKNKSFNCNLIHHHLPSSHIIISSSIISSTISSHLT